VFWGDLAKAAVAIVCLCRFSYIWRFGC